MFLIGIPTSICSTFSSRGIINSFTFVFYMEYTLVEGKKIMNVKVIVLLNIENLQVAFILNVNYLEHTHVNVLAKLIIYLILTITHDYKKIILSTKIKRKAEVSTTNSREVFNDCCRNSDGASCVNFKKMKSSIVKRRRLLQPKIPSSALEFGSLLRESKYSTNNLKTVIDDDQVAVIFG